MINTDSETKEGTAAMKYSTVYVKEDTKKRFALHINKRVEKKGGERVTADEALNALIDLYDADVGNGRN
jgi:hypothetical protein